MRDAQTFAMPSDSSPRAGHATGDRLPAIMPLRFWTVFKSDPERPSAYLEEDWVEWVKKGETSGATTQEAVSRLKPRPDGTSAVEWTAIGPAYEAWKAGQALPESGTPLDAWPGCPRQLAEALKKASVRSVEDFAELPDHLCDRIRFPGVKVFRDRARAYVQAQDVAAVADQIALRDRRIASQAEELDDMRRQMDELQGRIETLSRSDSKARRGRRSREARSAS